VRAAAKTLSSRVGLAMPEALQAQLGLMMRWQSRALVPAATFLMLAYALLAAEDLLAASPAVRLLLEVATLGALFPALVLWAITLWHVFHAGRLAFGVGSGLIYTFLAVTLLLWPGLFLIPHMVRLDAKRLVGVEPPEEEPAGPAAANPRPRARRWSKPSR
jgi:hypothetical protein